MGTDPCPKCGTLARAFTALGHGGPVTAVCALCETEYPLARVPAARPEALRVVVGGRETGDVAFHGLSAGSDGATRQPPLLRRVLRRLAKCWPDNDNGGRG